MIEDAALLRRYAVEKSEEAFAELVRRRVGLVYSVALRQVGGDAHLAEDVTQRVFADLARKAAALSARAVLSGWLYRSAQFAASDLVRAERRRRAREEETQTMNEPFAAEAAVDWEKVRPVLDETLGELADEDRDAVALRFFENRPFAEIGSALSISEDTARKRVERALDKLHALLSRRGVNSTAAALSVALAVQTGVAAPAGLAASVTSSVLAEASVTGAAVFLTSMSTSKITLSVVVLLLLAAAGILLSLQRTNGQLRAEISMLRRAIEHAPRTVAEGKVAVPAPERPRQDGPSKQISPPPNPSPAVEGARLSHAPAMLGVEAWENRGTATSADALESYLWAVDQVDAAVTAKTIGFGKLRPEVEAYFAGLSEGVRAGYDTPEKLWAAILTGAPHGARVMAFQVLSQNPDPSLGDNFSVLRVRTVKEGGLTEEGDIRFELTPDGWRRSLDDRANTLIEPVFNLFQSTHKRADTK